VAGSGLPGALLPNLAQHRSSDSSCSRLAPSHLIEFYYLPSDSTAKTGSRRGFGQSVVRQHSVPQSKDSKTEKQLVLRRSGYQPQRHEDISWSGTRQKTVSFIFGHSSDHNHIRPCPRHLASAWMESLDYAAILHQPLGIEEAGQDSKHQPLAPVVNPSPCQFSSTRPAPSIAKQYISL
jgi:hypothetical protein